MTQTGPPRGFEELILESVERVVDAENPGVTGETRAALLTCETENASVRSWAQTWPTTACLHSAPGLVSGQAITTGRVTAVQVGQHACHYLDGRYVYTLDLSEELAWECWQNGSALDVCATEGLRPEWDVPSTR